MKGYPSSLSLHFLGASPAIPQDGCTRGVTGPVCMSCSTPPPPPPGKASPPCFPIILKIPCTSEDSWSCSFPGEGPGCAPTLSPTLQGANGEQRDTNRSHKLLWPDPAPAGAASTLHFPIPDCWEHFAGVEHMALSWEEPKVINYPCSSPKPHPIPVLVTPLLEVFTLT